MSARAIPWACALVIAFAPLAAPAKSATSSSPVQADATQLKPGQFIWTPELAPAGPMVMVVNLKTQQAYVYRNGVRIGASTVSTGKKGKATPTGVFTILQKKKAHRSNLYNDAPMPYMQRLTWDGIALHAGNLPGYPASHGCVRLPLAFAQKLFAETEMGMTVVVGDGQTSPHKLDDGDILAPVSDTGRPVQASIGPPLAPDQLYLWKPELAPSGPVTLVLSSQDQRLIVMRDGKLIGRSKIGAPRDRIIGAHVLQFTGFDAAGRGRWIYIGVPGQEQKAGQSPDMSGVHQLHIPPEYLTKVRSVLKPGATLLVTDGGLIAGGAGKRMTVIDEAG
jgi:hypothetical protein